jgi:DNA-directed RNA polymerase subunit F
MAVTEETPITMAEVVALAGEGEKAEEIKRFIKNFTEMPVEKAKEMKEELRALDLMKLKEEHIVKIVDFIPTDASELNKTIIEVSLDQDEVNKILDVTKKY